MGRFSYPFKEDSIEFIDLQDKYVIFSEKMEGWVDLKKYTLIKKDQDENRHLSFTDGIVKVLRAYETVRKKKKSFTF